MHLSKPTFRIALLVGLAFVLLAGLGTLVRPELLAADPPNQPFDLIYAATNVKYNGIQQGTGMLGQTEGTVTNVDVAGPVVKAYLLWAGLGRDNDGVAFQRDQQPAVAVTPDYVWNNDTYGANTWNCCGNELSVYAADITNLGVAATGVHSYTLSDMSIQHVNNNNQLVEENWGYSLIIIYEDPTLPTPRDIFVKLGNDGFFFRWTGLVGPNSDVQCIAFEPANVTRRASFNVVVGGVAAFIRPNGLWGAAGSELYVDTTVEGGTWNQSSGLIDLPATGINGIGIGTEIDGPLDGDKTGNGVDWPFTDSKGDEWDEYPVFDVEIAPQEDWVCVQIESANRPELPPGPDNFNLPASAGFLGFIGVIESVDQPTIDIEKATNGEDADMPTGPVVEVGQTVTWTYDVTNSGSVTLTQIAVTDDMIGAVTCPQDTLAPGQSMTCIMTGTAVSGQYANLATVVGTPPTGAPVTDQDPSHYFGAGPAIVIEKATNGEDADLPTGPVVNVGDTVTWTYVVTNTGAVTLTEVTVTDDVIGPVTCPLDVLTPSQSMTCTMTGTAESGQYANLGTVVGTPPSGGPVTDRDPSHYFAPGPAIVIEKATNGEDADTPTGPALEVGQTVTWTYDVTNTGTVTLFQVAVTDDIIGAVNCPLDTLAPGQSMTCVMTGTAVAGQYANLGTVVGTPPEGTPVTDRDPSHYIGGEPAIDIEKATNGEDADVPTGPYIPVDGTVTWLYVVSNTGDVPLRDVTVTDDKIGAITCPQDTLAVGESMSCMAEGIAQAGQYENMSTVVGTSPAGQQVTDEDPSHYFGDAPAIDIEKATNGEDADTAPGPTIPEGGAVEWTYVVTNIGNVPLTNVTVTDNIEGAISCPKDTLAVGEVMTCTLTGTADTADYANNSTVVGTSPSGIQVTDADPSHYTMEPLAIDDPDAPEQPTLDIFIYLPIGVKQ